MEEPHHPNFLPRGEKEQIAMQKHFWIFVIILDCQNRNRVLRVDTIGMTVIDAP